MAQVVGGSIGEDQRQGLLVLLAAYHRLVRLPAGVELEAAAIRQAFPALLDLLGLLLDRAGSEAEAVQAALDRCRKALG